MILGLGGCGLVSSEMTNAASVSARAIKRHHQLDFLPEERPITMQLSGNDPDLIANAARMVEQLGADILDINCGCPSPKVTGGGHGSALLRDLPKMELLLKAVNTFVFVSRDTWTTFAIDVAPARGVAGVLGSNLFNLLAIVWFTF